MAEDMKPDAAPTTGWRATLQSWKDTMHNILDRIKNDPVVMDIRRGFRNASQNGTLDAGLGLAYMVFGLKNGLPFTPYVGAYFTWYGMRRQRKYLMSRMNHIAERAAMHGQLHVHLHGPHPG